LRRDFYIALVAPTRFARASQQQSAPGSWKPRWLSPTGSVNRLAVLLNYNLFRIFYRELRAAEGCALESAPKQAPLMLSQGETCRACGIVYLNGRLPACVGSASFAEGKPLKRPTESKGRRQRNALRLGAVAAAENLASYPTTAIGGEQKFLDPGPQHLIEVTVAELQARMASGELTARALVEQYKARIQAIDRNGPKLNSVLELNPDAEEIAAALDEERRSKGPRGPLHGIPVLLKDNIDTHDRMHTTAGSLALLGSTPPQDATVAARLREAGAVLLGKLNLSEWANFRSTNSSSGWSGRGGQCHNPYALDRTPCGSSSGSGAAVAANLCAVALGTETDGSILCPSGVNMVVAIKPTLGLTSRAGVIPIAHSQDTVGPFARTVADAATVLGALGGVDPRDPATSDSAGKVFTDYRQFLDPEGLKGARIGVIRQVFAGFQDKVEMIYNQAIEAMKQAGAIIVDPADLPSAQDIADSRDELAVLLFEFKQDLNKYLAERGDPAIHTLQDVIDFNKAHAQEELPFFGQDIFLQSQALDLDDPTTIANYEKALENNHHLGRDRGIDAVLKQFDLDALVAPTNSVPWKIDLLDGDHFLGSSSTPTSLAGYPAITVPAGSSFGLPIGITFMGTAWSEPKLIKLASGFEAVTKARQPPKFLSASTII
jgi:amidase